MPSQNHHILYLTRGGDISGEQRQLLYLVGGLEKGRYTPVVLCTQAGGFVDGLKDAGISYTVHPLAAWRRAASLWSRYRDARYLSGLTRSEEVSLIHCSDFWLTPYALRAARHAGIPCVLHIRAPIDAGKFRKYRCLEATTLVAVSKRIQMRLARAIPQCKDKVFLIHDAVDKDVFTPQADRAGQGVFSGPCAAAGKVTVGLVGRVEEGKEQMGFVQIAREVLKKTSRAAFVIIGEIKDQAYHKQILQYMKAHGLMDQVCFAGRREDMPQVLAGLDVLLSLSGGSVRYEAMMCGVPVVCAWSRTAEESYHIQHEETGFLVPQRDIAPVADVLTRLVEDADLRARIGRKARVWAEQHLSHATLVEDTQRLYEGLLRTPQGAEQR